MSDQDDVNVKIGAKLDGLLAGIEQSKAAILSLASPVNSIVASMQGATEAIAAAFGVKFLIGFAQDMAEAGLQAERTAAMLGITTSAVGVLSGIAKLTGTSLDGMATSLERMSLNVQRSTKDALGSTAQALKVLGLNAKDLIGLPADQYFDKLRSAVSQFNPSLNLTNALMAVGGRGIAQMIPMLQLSQEAWDALKARIAEAKGTLNGFVPAASETHANLTILDIATSSLSKALFLSLKPAIDGTIKSLTDFVMWLRDAGKEGNTLSPIWDTMAFAAKTLATALASILAIVQGLGLAVSALFKLAMGDIAEFENYARKAVDDFEKLGRSIKSTLTGIWAPTITVAKEAGAAIAAAINEMARQQIQSAVLTAETILAVRKQQFERERVQIGLSADLWQTTENQRYAATIDATNRSYAAERASLEKIRELWRADPVEYAKKTKAIEILDATHQTEMVRLNAESVKAQQRNWDQMFGAIESSFNANLRGLLAGTMTWGKAFKTMLGDMVIFFIQQVEKMVFKWIAGQLAQLTATQATEAAKATAAVVGEEATLPVRIGKFLSDIAADAALVFAGIFASLAPVMGPAAAGPAAAGQATVMAQAGNVPKLDVGTDRVLRSGLAILHEDESVVPAAQTSGPFSGGAAGGAAGGGAQISIQAWDGASVARWLKRGGAQTLAAAIAGAQRRNPSTRGSY